VSYRGAKLTGFKHHKKNHSILQNFTNSLTFGCPWRLFFIKPDVPKAIFNCLWAICAFLMGNFSHFDSLALKKGQKSPKEKYYYYAF
jgi:hypothetical protein